VAARSLALPTRLGIHVLTSVACSALHIAVMAGLRYPVHALFREAYAFDFGPANLFYEYRKDLLTFFLAVGLAALWRRGLRGHEAAAGAPAPGTEPAFLVPGREGDLLVRAGEIDWVEAQGNYVALHVRGQERLLRQPLKEIEAKLADMAFIRTHRSALVNMRRVRGITRTELGESRVEFENRDSAPLSARRRAEVVRALAAH
jgi:DNA-binding LytR/AlgR family response regulator